MEKHLNTYGFKYRFNDRNYALVVEAQSEAAAKEEVLAIAKAVFISELSPVSTHDSHIS